MSTFFSTGDPQNSLHILPEEMSLLTEGIHPNPHAIYGAHPTGKSWIIRTVKPLAKNVFAVFQDGSELPLEHLGNGIFGTEVPTFHLASYQLRSEYDDGSVVLSADGYRCAPTLGELDLHLMGEGRHERLWEALGAHPCSVEIITGEVIAGTAFRVWAPHARGISVVGDFNRWHAHAAPLRRLAQSGIWEVFIPHVGAGALYKFCVQGADRTTRWKADPYAFQAEHPPRTASVVSSSSYSWKDHDWIARRALSKPVEEPLSIYEVHLGSFAPGLGYRELAERIADHACSLRFTHVELLPVAEYPFGGSWGYQVTSYFAPTSRYGEPDDFRAFVDHLHSRGLGVIMDWVPAHFPKDEWALGRFDGTPLYEHPDPHRGEHPDWGTYVFDFGRHEVRNFLVANALFWFEEFHIDGLRVDAVASMLYLDYSRPDGQWTPNIHGGRENLDAVQFLQELNATVHKHHPGIVTIAEESTEWPGVTRLTSLGGLGFTMKWNMGWMHDSLRYFHHDPIHRMYHHNEITFSLMYAWSENYLLPISHDEVVHGKGTLWSRMPGTAEEKAAGVRSFLASMWTHPGKKLLFMGQEFGQSAEWSADKGLDWWELDGDQGHLHQGILDMVRDVGEIYLNHSALWSLDNSPEGFQWIDSNDAHNNVLSLLRFSQDGSMVACVVNLSGVDIPHYRIGVPCAGEWREILHTNARRYAGSGEGHLGSITATTTPWHGRDYSLEFSLIKLSTIWLTAPPPPL